MLRRRAAERLASDSRRLARRARLRLRLRGPDRGASGRCSRRSPGRAEVRSRFPTSPGASAFASLAAHRRGPRGARRRPDRGARRRAPRSSPRRRSRISSATLFEPSAARRRRLDGAVRFLEGAGTRGTLELVGEEVLALLRGGTPAEQIALVVPVARALARAARDGLRRFGIPYAIEAPRAARRRRRSVRRCSRCCASPGASAAGASSTRSCARRTPGSRVRASTSSRAGCAGARSHGAERVEEETERLREAPLVALRELRAAASPLDGVRALLAVDGALRLRARRAAGRRDRRGSTCARCGAALRAARRARGAGARSARRSARRC